MTDTKGLGITPEMIGIKCFPGSEEYATAAAPLRKAVENLKTAAEEFERATGFRLTLDFDLEIPKREE